MTSVQKLMIKQSELRSKIAGELEKEDKNHEVLENMSKEMQKLEVELRAALAIEEVGQPADVEQTPEAKEMSDLKAKVDFRNYLASALSGAEIRGAEREYNTEIGMASNYFPLDVLVPQLETRTKRDGDSATSQSSWLDRVFHNTAATSLGVTMQSVGPGVSSFPVMTAGGGAAQRGRTEATDTSTYTFSITELKPARASVSGLYTIEDDARLPGMADAIRRDMAMGMTEAIDLKIFNGDSGANENGADITGLQTASITETEIKQADKVKPAETLAVFLAYVDGQYAASMADVNVVASVGTNVLWGGTIANSSAENQTIAGFLRANGLNWVTRGGIDTATASGDFAGYVGLGRGIAGAGVAAVWQAGQLIVDPYSNAKTGQVELTMHYLWNFALPRAANFKRWKYVT